MIEGKVELVDVTVKVHHSTDKAILVSDTDDKDAKKVWLPYSQIEVEMKSEGIAEITMPEWLAMEKELI